MPPDDVARRLAAVRRSTEQFVQGLRRLRLSDEAVRAGSLLPGWTRAHVLAHVARNADGMAAALSGTLRGEPTPMYASAAAREADIAAGADRAAAALVDDVAGSAARLDGVWSAMTDDAWDADALTRAGPMAAWRLLGVRWREVEIHWVDLDVGYGPGDWPAAFAAPLLPALVEPARLGPRLPADLTVDIEATDSGQHWSVGTGPAHAVVRAPTWALVGWLIGRPAAARAELGQPPALAPWS